MFLAKSTLNPAWPHFVGGSCLALACIVGLVHLLLSGWSDPNHCHALLTQGSWLDSKHKHWQPEGCMLHTYTEKEAFTCLQQKEIKFIGDSVTRKLFFQVGQALDSTLPRAPKNNTQKHADHFLQTQYGTNITFVWDPFLNSSQTEWALTGARTAAVVRGDDPPAMLVLGSGLWYLRYATTSGGLPAWESKMDSIFKTFAMERLPADEVVVLPIGQVVPSKLSAQRAETMQPADIDAMNSDLYHRIHPPLEQPGHMLANGFSKPRPLRGISLPLVFNSMLDDSLTEDGLHYSDSVIKLQARILLNLHCNNVLPKVFPMNKTCCNPYPLPSILHAIVLATVILTGPLLTYRTLRAGPTGLPSMTSTKWILPPAVISMAIMLIYTADRTGFWVKEQKQFDPWTFGFLCILTLAIGLLTLERGEIDMGFLNREQTDEWKGWMQVIILVYHYFGGSKISGIYNPIRLLVAAYLFMTGYGHTMFYLRKADFGFLRIAQVLVRLNLFTILLAYTMNTDYISYYFTPLVSLWYLVVYFTMFVAARFNDRTPFLVAKILLSALLMTWLMNESWLLQALFNILHRFCAIHWSSREWAFRVNLDIWIVFVGMLAAVVCIKLRDYRVFERTWWPLAGKVSVGISVLVFVWFFVFELHQQSKFTYNTWHPYISPLPVLAYMLLRNATPGLRSVSSKAFVLVGKCSLEAFVIQYHLWLAGDSKGVLLVLPLTRWRPLNFVITTVMFLYVCDRVAHASVDLTMTICGVRKMHLPPPVTETLFNAALEEAREQDVSVPLANLRSAESVSKEGDEEEALLPLESDTPVRGSVEPSRVPSLGWLFHQGWFWKLGTQVFIFIFVLWLLNVFWWYPPGATF